MKVKFNVEKVSAKQAKFLRDYLEGEGMTYVVQPDTTDDLPPLVIEGSFGTKLILAPDLIHYWRHVPVEAVRITLESIEGKSGSSRVHMFLVDEAPNLIRDWLNVWMGEDGGSS